VTATEILPATFAYDDDKQSIVIEQRFSEAQALMRQGLTAMIEAGGKFAEIRDLLSHNRAGGFDGWIEAKQLGRRTVYKIIELHATFGTVQHIARLDIATTAAYLLAAPSVPDEARAEALARAEAGERITVAAAKVIVAEHAPAPANGNGADARPFATVEQIEAAVRTWLPTYSRERSTQLATLSDMRSRNAAGNGPLAKLIDSPALPRPFRMADVLTACSHVLSELQAPAPQPGKVVTFAPPPSLTDPQWEDLDEPQAEPDSADEVSYVDLPAIVLAWLDDQVENLQLADDPEARTYCLGQILKARNGLGNPSAAATWRSLRAYAGWPADLDADTKAAAVRAALARLNGEEEEPVSPAAAEESHEVELPAPALRRHSWDGVQPVAGNGNGHRPKPARTAPPTQADILAGHVERFIIAAETFRIWAGRHAETLEDDAELRGALDLLEEARRQALGSD
jgi:hypothetical protein